MLLTSACPSQAIFHDLIMWTKLQRRPTRSLALFAGTCKVPLRDPSQRLIHVSSDLVWNMRRPYGTHIFRRILLLLRRCRGKVGEVWLLIQKQRHFNVKWSQMGATCWSTQDIQIRTFSQNPPQRSSIRLQEGLRLITSCQQAQKNGKQTIWRLHCEKMLLRSTKTCTLNVTNHQKQKKRPFQQSTICSTVLARNALTEEQINILYSQFKTQLSKY